MQDSADVDQKMKGYINHAFHAAHSKTIPLLRCILGCCLLGSASGAHPAYFTGGWWSGKNLDPGLRSESIKFWRGEGETLN